MNRKQSNSLGETSTEMMEGPSIRELGPFSLDNSKKYGAGANYDAVEFSECLIKNGYRVVPIPCGAKGPKILRWNQTIFKPKDFLHKLNIGVLTGQGIAMLDIDVTDKVKVDAIVSEFIDRFDACGTILIRTGSAPKVGIPIRAPDGIKKKTVKLGDGHQIEVLGAGQQFVAYGKHPSGSMYTWDDRGSLLDHAIERLPVLSEHQIDAFLNWAAETFSVYKADANKIKANSPKPDRTSGFDANDLKIIELLNSRRNTLPLGSYEDWRNICFGTRVKYRDTHLEKSAHNAFAAFSLSWESGETNVSDIEKLWNSEREREGKRIGPGTAIKLLRALPSKAPVADPEEGSVNQKLIPPSQIGAKFTGLAGRLYQQLTLASDRQSSNIQIGGVLATLSAIIGPCAVIQNGVKGKCCTNLYILALAATGAGKETVRTLVSSSLNSAHRGDEVLGGSPSDVSFQMTLNLLGGRAALLIDEAGILAKAVKSSSNSHQRLLMGLLMKTYGCGLTRLEARKYKDAKQNIDSVERPRVTLMMTSTVQDFVDGASREDSASGFFNRLVAFVDEEHIPYKSRGDRPDSQAVIDLSEDIVRSLSFFCGVQVGPALPNRLPDVAVFLSDEALSRLEDFKFVEVEQHQAAGGTRAETWSRAVENAQRVAGLLAVSDALTDDLVEITTVKCDLSHVDLALQIVRQGLVQLERIAHLAGRQPSRHEELKDKVLRFIQQHNGKATRTQINRAALRGVRNEERHEILDVMVSDGEIVMEDLPADGRSGPRPNVYFMPNSARQDGGGGRFG